jgi:hypothetical protein
VLDVALAADPANRYATAQEFASALSQVMKQAVGVDPANALGTAVLEARQRERARDVEADALTLPGAPRGKRDSVDVEFSTAEANVDPIELTPKKK